MLRGRRPKAAHALKRLRPRHFTDQEISSELDELQQAIDDQPKNGRFLDIFKRDNLKRTMLACMMNFFQQATGQSFSSQYGTLFVKSLGGVDAFTINMVNNAVNVAGILVCIVLSDRVGRRYVTPLHPSLRLRLSWLPANSVPGP